MKHILTIAFMLVCATISAQDTLCVMICLDEVIYFDFQTSKIETRFDHKDDFELPIKDGEVLCLHLCDDKKRHRDVTTTFKNGDHFHNTFNSKDNVIYTKENWGDIVVHVSKARRVK